MVYVYSPRVLFLHLSILLVIRRVFCDDDLFKNLFGASARANYIKSLKAWSNKWTPFSRILHCDLIQLIDPHSNTTPSQFLPNIQYCRSGQSLFPPEGETIPVSDSGGTTSRAVPVSGAIEVMPIAR
jgi:hypothetical protein